MSCRIFRDIDTEAVERVETVRGEESQLYKDALQLTNSEEEALNIWAYAHTPGFTDVYGDWIKKPYLLKLGKTREPLLADVMLALNMDKGDARLGVKDSVAVHNFIAESGLTVDSLYSTLKKAFFNSNGQFVIDRKKLVATGLYLQDEITNMMNYPSIRGQVLDTLTKLRNTLKTQGNAFDEIGPEGVESDHPLNITTGEANSLGKFEKLPIEEVEEYLKTQVGEYVTEEAFKEKLNSLDREDIREAVLNNPESIDYIRQLVQNSRVVPVLVNRDGVLVQKKKNDMSEILRNTITVNDSKVYFTEMIDELRNLDYDSWSINPEGVAIMLGLVEQRATKAGIDLSGLQAQYMQKSQEEIVGFLDLVDDFNIKTEEMTLSDADIDEFSDDLTEFFDREDTPEMRSVPIIPQFRNKNLIMVEGTVDENQVYRTDGLIKAFGNLYQRVDNFNNYESAVEEVYANLQSDITLLPREAFKSFGLKNGRYDVAAITNPANKTKVINSINRFITQNAEGAENMEDYNLNKEIALMKTIFNPRVSEPVIQNNVADRLQSFKGDYGYLTTDFISDFYLRMLDEKVSRQSDLWNTALKHFTINDKGIDMLTQSPEILSQVKLVLQSEPILYNNLVNYALISKNQNLNFLQEFSSDVIMDTIETRRDFVTNNPQVLNRINRDYTKLTDYTVLLRNSNVEFIKLNDGIYELSTSDNGVSIYSKLVTGVNPNFYDFGLSYPIVEDVDVQSYKDASPEKFVEDVSGVSKSKLDDMQDEMSCVV